MQGDTVQQTESEGTKAGLLILRLLQVRKSIRFQDVHISTSRVCVCGGGGGGGVKENMVKMQLINTIGYTQSAPAPSSTHTHAEPRHQVCSCCGVCDKSKGAQATRSLAGQQEDPAVCWW